MGVLKITALKKWNNSKQLHYKTSKHTKVQ